MGLGKGVFIKGVTQGHGDEIDSMLRVLFMLSRC